MVLGPRGPERVGHRRNSHSSPRRLPLAWAPFFARPDPCDGRVGGLAAMSRSGDELLEMLSTSVLASVARLRPAGILRGQAEPSRLSRRRRFPAVDFYGEETMVGGLPGHRHARPELAVVLAGRLNIVIDRVVYLARAGDWVVFEPNVLHGECALASASTYRLLWFIADRSYLGLHVTRYRRSSGYEVLAARRFGDVACDVKGHLRRLGTRPWEPLGESRRRLVRVISWCLDRLGTEPAEASPGPHPLVAEVQQILLRTSARPPSVVALANRVGLSPNYLSSLFRRETGQTIRRFVEALRIEQARQQLSDPERSVKQVAYTLGFADPQHFSHAFRRATGTSPTAYRRRLSIDSDT